MQSDGLVGHYRLPCDQLTQQHNNTTTVLNMLTPDKTRQTLYQNQKHTLRERWVVFSGVGTTLSKVLTQKYWTLIFSNVKRNQSFTDQLVSASHKKPPSVLLKCPRHHFMTPPLADRPPHHQKNSQINEPLVKVLQQQHTPRTLTTMHNSYLPLTRNF